MWSIPQPERDHCGYVFSSAFASEAQARDELARLIGRSDVESDYSRHLALGVARFSFDFAGSGPAPAPRHAARGHIHSAGSVTFTAERGDAAEVAVVGSFNGWDPRRGRMQRGADGRWQLSLDLPPGNHRYMLWVDGAVVAPGHCRRWVADGFGARNCVVSVGKRPTREAAK